MKLSEAMKPITWFFAASCVATLLACGGGGGANPASAPTPTYPASGTYAAALKATGSSTSPSLGLSLIHPDERSTEYQIETTTANLTDLKTMYSGTVDVAGSRITAVQPVALLYIAGGDIKFLPLVANGKHPKTNVLGAGVTTLCKVMIEGNDYGTPTSSRYIASTKGPDGICGTADDGEAEIIFDSVGKPSIQRQLSSSDLGYFLGMLRDPATQKPAAWVSGDRVQQWYPTPTDWIMRIAVVGGNSNPPITRVVAQSPDAVVAEYNNKLTVWSMGLTAVELVLNAAITSGTGWQSIGFDSSNFYVYYSSGSTTTSTWKIVKISRGSPTATLLASGSGFVAGASMGTSVLFPTIVSGSGYTLYKMSKTVPGTPVAVEGPSTEMLDEVTGNKPYAAAGGVLQGIVEATAIDLRQSENRSRFIFATGATAATFMLGATLVSYDTATRLPTIAGNLPGSAEYGNNLAMASTSFGAMNLQGGFVSAISGGTLQSSTLKMFSFDLQSANSLQYTTTSK
jgi:hypothetical protein